MHFLISLLIGLFFYLPTAYSQPAPPIDTVITEMEADEASDGEVFFAQDVERYAGKTLRGSIKLQKNGAIIGCSELKFPEEIKDNRFRVDSSYYPPHRNDCNIDKDSHHRRDLESRNPPGYKRKIDFIFSADSISIIVYLSGNENEPINGMFLKDPEFTDDSLIFYSERGTKKIELKVVE